MKIALKLAAASLGAVMLAGCLPMGLLEDADWGPPNEAYEDCHNPVYARDHRGRVMYDSQLNPLVSYCAD